MKKISFVSDGYTLAGNLCTADIPKKCAFLFIQGWTGHQNTRAAALLASQGFTSMTYDMRGNGESEGDLADFSRADFLHDAELAYDYLRNEVGADVAIGVIGSSFGSYTAVLLSVNREVACLALRVPANYPDEEFDMPQKEQFERTGDFKVWRKRVLDHTQNHALGVLHAFKGPVLIIEAGADELVPAQIPKNYAAVVDDKSKLTYEIMEGAPHRLATDQLNDTFEKLLTNWIVRL